MLPLPFSAREGDNSYTVTFNRSDRNMPSFISIAWEIREDCSYSRFGLASMEHFLSGTIQYTVSGQGQLERDGLFHRLESGHALLVERPDDHRYYVPGGEGPWEYLSLTFDGEDALLAFRRVREMYGSVVSFSFSHPVMQLLCELGTLIYEERLTRAEEGAEWLYRIMMALRQLVLSREATHVPPILCAIQYANKHFTEDIGIEDMARAADLSVPHFSRLFRELGRTPYQYIIWMRLRYARILLKQTTLNVEDIATRCGFQNASYFGKVFHKVIGVSPLTFRRDPQVIVDDLKY